MSFMQRYMKVYYSAGPGGASAHPLADGPACRAPKPQLAIISRHAVAIERFNTSCSLDAMGPLSIARFEPQSTPDRVIAAIAQVTLYDMAAAGLRGDLYTIARPRYPDRIPQEWAPVCAAARNKLSEFLRV